MFAPDLRGGQHGRAMALNARQGVARVPLLEGAFLQGYGHDPREAGLRRCTLVVEAIGTSVWAFGVGNEQFEQVGLRQIAQLRS